MTYREACSTYSEWLLTGPRSTLKRAVVRTRLFHGKTPLLGVDVSNYFVLFEHRAVVFLGTLCYIVPPCKVFTSVRLCCVTSESESGLHVVKPMMIVPSYEVRSNHGFIRGLP